MSDASLHAKHAARWPMCEPRSVERRSPDGRSNAKSGMRIRAAYAVQIRALAENGYRRTTGADFRQTNEPRLRRIERSKPDPNNCGGRRHMEQIRCERCRCDGGRPTQEATIVIPLEGRAWAHTRSAHTRRQSARPDPGSARNVMMKIRDRDLHTEREKRQPKQPQAKSRNGHRSPSVLPAAEVG
jgi:hypothetical protein